MPRYDFRTPRLFVEAPLARGAPIALDREQANYLANVLRLRAGGGVLAFNGRDGEWRRRLRLRPGTGSPSSSASRRGRRRAPGDLHYLFAPLKHARLDYMVQKAVEMGATRLQPVLTRHTQAERVNLKRMRANAIEAAEQCGILTVAEIGEPATLPAAVAALDPSRLLVFCDEDAEIKDPVAALAQTRLARPGAGRGPGRPGGRICRRGTRLADEAPARRAARARPAHPARRYGGGCRPGARRGGAGRLALTLGMPGTLRVRSRWYAPRAQGLV